MRKNKILIAVLLYVAILAFVPTISAAGYPVPVQFFYVPIPEDQHLLALKTIESGGSGTDPGEPMQSYISISAIADNTIIYYDQYENGFESDVGNPINIYTSANTGGTQIWGDGNTSNGVPPGVPSDIIKAGTVIVLNNPVTTTDSSTVIKYGGRDKIASTKTISVVRAGWSTGPNTLMADANEVFDTDSWGTDFRVPVGEDIPDTTDYQMFEYTGMTIMAGHGGATVNIDADNSGSYETTKSLTEGESYLVNGGVKVGAHISSDNPVQIDLITGDKASNYESRFFRLLPTNLWSSSSYTPVSTPATVGSLTCGTTVWIYNPSSSALTVQYERRTASGLTTSSLSVPANGYLKQVLTDGYGAHFYTTGNKFYALSTTDSTSSTFSNNQAWDWGFTLVPENSLTSQLLIGLGIGRDPTSGTNPNENGNPVWVTPIGNGDNAVTIYVDYDADPTTGSLTDPNGNKYDKSYSLLECERAKVYKPSGDQTGMLLYTLDGTKLAGAWGQDPSAASAAAPGLDLGTGVPPTPLFDAGKTATLSEDRDNDGYVSPGDVILYTIVINNIARLPVSDILLQDSLPVDVSYVADSITLYKSFTGTTTPITDSGSTAFPLDEGGIVLDSNTALPVRQSYTVTFKVTIKNFVNLTPGVAQIVNTGYASSDGVKTPFETRTPLYGSIGDFVWADIDGDGIQDVYELGVTNVTVNLLDGSGNPVFDVYGNTMTTLTNATGFYKFVGLLPGNYSVQFIKPIGYNFSLQDQGTNDTLDSDADPATGRTNAITLSAGETNNMMDAGLFNSIPKIDLEKYTNGEDADNAPGPYVGIGSTVTWTYNVTNTGNVNLTSVVVSDNMGVIPTYVSGDNGNSILEVGESWIYNATGVATAGQYANIGNVTADYKGTPVTDEDPSHYFGSSTAIDIEKYTNGEDADNAPGPYVGIGSTVTWTYNVTNTGNVNLTSVVVSDNMGVIPTYVSGDNGNSILEVGESWIYNATGVATAGQYANIGNVTADYKGTPVTDEDPSHYFGSSTAIDIEKYTNGEDADNAPGPYVGIGSTVTWTYNVTNTGNVNLTSVVVSDNMGVIPTLCPVVHNGNSILDQLVDFMDIQCNRSSNCEVMLTWIFIGYKEYPCNLQ
ncbi:SdrD B-like domain-containing protein [uncultured Methanomethylovorans sp.]|uniref:SdrD B-like domain-containing protein n=1 Tax=uncultured Methanomethylovorans sp. TaxID=183759 RepID=UPI002AA73F59|nr:SdrD B-like domain-containing protein [uncultured Methanomethylovorans sp.]